MSTEVLIAGVGILVTTIVFEAGAIYFRRYCSTALGADAAPAKDQQQAAAKAVVS